MFQKHSIAGRVVVGKVTGLVIGLLTIAILPLIPVAVSLEFKLGFLLLMILMGITIGLIGIFVPHPVFSGIRLHWWMRGPMIGGLYFLLLVLLAKDELQPFMTLDIIHWMGFNSPYWAILDGMFLGGLIGYITTTISGEGEMPAK